MTLRSLPLPCLVVTFIIILSGCAGNEQPISNPGLADQPKPPNSVERLSAPGVRSQALSAKLNTYRAQEFSVINSVRHDVPHSDVLYTAALRHAAYLNTVNSALYRPGSTLITDNIEATTFTPTSTYVSLHTEPVLPTTTSAIYSRFPALYSGALPYNRILAISGANNVLFSSANSAVGELFVTLGNLSTDGGANSDFRGFSEASTDPSNVVFDAVDNLWYSIRGRMALMRPSLAYFGYGTKNDSGTEAPPWPLFNGVFAGVLLTTYSLPQVSELGIWPNGGNTNVNPYGLDPDVATYAAAGSVRHQYSGPPISISLPVNEPLLSNGGLQIGFRKLRGNPQQPGSNQPVPASQILRNFTVVGLQQSGTVYPLTGDTTAAAYEYTFVSSHRVVVADPAYIPLQNELFFIPTEPLEANSWYEVEIRLQTATYTFPNAAIWTALNQTAQQTYKWQFKTNANVSP